MRAKTGRRIWSGVLAAIMLAMALPTQAYAYLAEKTSPITLTDSAGNTITEEESWQEDYPYGLLALENSQLTVTEGGGEMTLKVYRMGATTGKISAVVQYMPVVTQNEDGSYNYDSAISADDVVIQVEDPLPVTAYQPWGMDPDPEETETAIVAASGVDGEGLACTILSLNLEGGAEAYQWYTKAQGADYWEEVALAQGSELPVGEEELAAYDFRCVFTLNGVDYCTDSYQGEAYVKPQQEELPQAPADLELNPEPTFTTLDLTQGSSLYDGILFEVTFAEGEYEKEIRISAKDDALAEMDEFASITIVDSVGGDVLESMNTLLLRVADNDQDAAEAAQVGFVEGQVSFDKSAGTASITVRRTGGTVQGLSVDWALEAGTAQPGVDYMDASGTLYFYGSQTEQTIQVELINDQIEDLEEKTFTVRLSNLQGDDDSAISTDACVVGLYNTNTAQDLNLASTLYDVEAVDVSGDLTEVEGAPMQSGTVTGSQSTDSGEEGTGAVEWGESGDISLLAWNYNNGGAITFSGGSWGSTVTYKQSDSNSGNHSVTQSVANMCKLYYRFSTWVTGSAKFASGWDRFLYGDEEYAYTYFQVEGDSPTFYGDVNPRFYRSGFLGININLGYRSSYSVSGSFDYNDTYNTLRLGTKTFESRPADGNISSSATTTLYRRTFNNPFYLTVYTANDANVTDAAHYAQENYDNIISQIAITNGGTNGGKLYQGSTVELRLGATHLECTSAYLVDANGNTVANGSMSNGNKTATFSNLMLDPNGTYTFRLVLERRQDVVIDVTTSSLTNTTDQAQAYQDAYDLLMAKNTAGGKITVGYTPTNTLTGSSVGVTSKDVAITDTMFDKNAGTVTIPYTTGAANVQWINFNLPEDDLIIFNGKSYAGNAKIELGTGDLAPKTLRFYFYEKEFLTVERPMKVTLDSTALYFDGNGNGQIDGYFDRALGTFVVDEDSGDSFVAFLDGDYQETDFQPVVDSDGTVHQYFLRPYYTANAVAIIVPQGHSESERMQVMPSFITDVTNTAAYAALTDEQKEYRTIVSGQTTIKENSSDGGETGYSADNHVKYTAAATAYSYVDIPLGGDTNPSYPMTNTMLANDAPENGPYTKDGVEYQILDGLVYYYSATAPSNLGNAVYVWEPEYKGNLLYPYLYPYDSPAPITIARSIAGDNISIAGSDNLVTWYQKADGNWTSEAPTEETKGSYKTNSLGAYITDIRANEAGTGKLNAYLGAFGSNDTFALTVQEQSKTTGEILDARSGASTLADGEEDKTDTVTRGTVGSFPNSDYLQQNTGSGDGASGSSAGKGAYEEFAVDAAPELFSFSSEALAAFSIETDGYEISMSFGIPVYGKDNSGGTTGSAANTFDDVKETAGKVRDFIKAIRNQTGSPASNLVGEDLDANNLSAKSIEFTVNVQVGIILKYNTLDNTYVFSEAALAASAGIEIRLQHRFTPVPILYVYAQFSAELGASTGLAQERRAVLGDEILKNQEIKLTEGSETSSQYYFTTDKKGFQLTFTGQVYMEAYTFDDEDGDGVYDDGEELTGQMAGFNPGYLSSDGSEPTEVILVAQDGFDLTDPVVVVLTVMDDGDSANTATATLTDLYLIEDVKQDLYWTGLRINIEGAIELGVGIGIEIAKAELYAKASVALAFAFGAELGSDEGGSGASFDEFSLSLGLGFRIVFLFFSYEQDLISYTLTYEGPNSAEGGDGTWSHSWSALGGQFGGDLEGLSEGAGENVEVRITPPSRVIARVYDNGVTGQTSDLESLAYEVDGMPFEVSGYGSSVDAFKLMDGVTTGYDYQIVTVGDRNYVVYTGTRTGVTDADSTLDDTELRLSKLDFSQTGTDGASSYGLVNPIADKGTESTKYVPVDGDGTGDLDFYAWADADGKTIHVIWVSYETAATAPVEPTIAKYTSNGETISANNYETIAKPAGGTYDADEASGNYWTPGGDTLTIDGIAVTAENYGSVTITEVEQPEMPQTAPVETDYYTTEAPATGDEANWKNEVDTSVTPNVTYYFPSRYTDLAAAKQAYTDAKTAYDTAIENYEKELEKYNAYMSADAVLTTWKSYFAWFDYYSASDPQNQVTNASRNTVVKHATFDTTDTSAAGFGTATTISTSGDTYYFLPQGTAEVAVFAQSVPYTAEEQADRLAEYSKYLDATTMKASDSNVSDPNGYLAASKAYRLGYQESLLSVYGGNSRLTITGADGTAYENGTMTLSNSQGTSATNEILTNLDLAEIDGVYYLSYVTQQDTFTQDTNGNYTDLVSISRLYLRTFSIAEGKVTWGDPYLLRTVVNSEQNNSLDGVYTNGTVSSGSAPVTQYTDAYLANVTFLTAKLGDKLPTGTTEDFETFSEVQEETFLLFEMNGSTYVIRQGSLESITDPDGEHTGTINPFFTPEQVYGEVEDGQNLSSGKNGVVIGADGDGNVAAVYTSSVPNTVNNAIYISYWDPDEGVWSSGVMLAMNNMTVYERSIAQGWDDQTTEAAYFSTEDGGSMTQFTFSNLQIALGRREGGSDTTTSAGAGLLGEGEETTLTIQANSAQAAYGDILAELGISLPGTSSLTTLSEGYSEAERYALREQVELLSGDAVANSAPSSELLILTQGSLLELVEDTDNANNTVIVPANNDGRAEAADVGIYAISYGKGEQQVGNACIQFPYTEFTTGKELYAFVSFANVGDTAIRGSADQPITVKLMLHADGSEDMVMTSWTITQSIAAGQSVRLSTDQQPCAALTQDLGDGDYFYITVEEADYYQSQGGQSYTYNSATETTPSCSYKYLLESKAELGVEGLTGAISRVEQDGRIAVDVSFDVTNRGDAKAEDVFVQFTYLSGYDANGEAIYSPLDISDSELFVSQEQIITSGVDLLSATADNLPIGVIMLDTDDTYYTSDYYITEAAYNEILGRYYSTSEKSGWTSGTYNGVTYWYDSKYYGSAYAAYTAGQEAVGDWVYDSTSGNYYSSDYSSYSAAKDAADAARKMEYILTADQYNALSASEKSAWKEDSGYYIPVNYANYAAAEDAYQEALSADEPQIRQNYMRTVEGTIYVSADKFNGAESGSLNLRVEVFSKTSNANFSNSLYTSDHSDEYNAANNQATVQLEQTAFVTAPDRVILGQYGTHRLPVTVRTTTGQAPQLRVLEVEDGAKELGTLYFTAEDDGDGIDSTLTGYLTVVGNNMGQGVIHIVDTATNTTYPIVYRVEAQGDGTNIYNDDAQFTFYNADGDPYSPDQPRNERDWDFQDASGWASDLRVPYLSNLAVADQGAYFTFQTQGSEFEFDLIGEATVTSNRFPGTYTISGDEDDPTSETVDFGNDNGVTHTITVKVTSGTAWFDVVRVTYGTGYTPSDDAEAPGLYFSRSFPLANTVSTRSQLDFIVYAVDNSGLQDMTLTGDCVTGATLTKTDDGLWAYSFQVTGNGSFTAQATDTSGNTTTRRITVDWFSDSPQNTEAGTAPTLTASIWKVDGIGSWQKDLFATGNENVVITTSEFDEGYRAKFRVTQPASGLTYYKFGQGDFQTQTEEVASNGYYMVRATSDNSYGTWSQQIFYVDRFAPMPQVSISRDDNSLTIKWSAVKDEDSTEPLVGVKLNGAIDLVAEVSPQSGSNSYSGTFNINYGGAYTVEATDARGVTGSATGDFTVPVDLSGAEITTEDPWGQPDGNGARYGSVTIDFTNVTGGDYVAESATGALADYYGSYQYLVLTNEEYTSYKADDLTDGTASDLSNRTDWKDAAHDATVTWSGLQADEDGTEYIVLVRDKQNPTEYSTMAVHSFTLVDNAVDYTSISASLASTPEAADGNVYVSADKGQTGYLEFAILPVEPVTPVDPDPDGDGDQTQDEPPQGDEEEQEPVYPVLTAEDFQDDDVTWVPGRWDNVKSGVLTGLAEGRYQVAIRALYGNEEQINAAQTAWQAAQAAAQALETVLSSRDNAAADMVRTIDAANSALMAAEDTLADAQAAWEAIQDSTTATDEEKQAAQDAVTEAQADVDDAQAVYDAALAAADLTEEEETQIKAFRTAWLALPEGEEKEVARSAYTDAVSAACLAYQTTQYGSQISAAEGNVSTTQAAYESAAATLTAASAQAYEDDPTRWDGMITCEALQITVRSGEGSSLQVLPTVASSNSASDGTIQVTAEGGSAYDGGDAVHYQFAFLRLEDEEDAVDYTGDMGAIAALDLDWQFADDLLNEPNKICFQGLGSGWYQVFVRVVYDPDVSDSYDVNAHLIEGSSSLAVLRAAYEAALEGKEPTAIANKANEAHSLYVEWADMEDDDEDKAEAEQALRTALGGTQAEQDNIITLADAWNEATASDEKAEAYDAYRAALTELFTNQAQDAYYTAEQQYITLRDEIDQQVDEAYENTPGYYDTASFTSAYVGVYVSPSQIIKTEYGDGAVTYTIQPGGSLNTSDMRTIYESNQDLVVHLLRGDLHIVLPVGILKDMREADKVFTSYTGGTGNVVRYTDEDGQKVLVSISLVEDDTIAYVYLGEGTYRLTEYNGSFDDIAGHWAEESILFTADRKVFQGMDDGLFHPEMSMTRAMAITVLHRMMGEPVSTADIPFTDVPASAWYMDALRWAYESGVVDGVSPTQFAPNQAMTREQLVTMLYRFLNQFGLAATESADLDEFRDSDTVSDYAVEAFRWAVATGVVDGMDGKRLAPKDTATRAQIAAVCERMIRYILA